MTRITDAKMGPTQLLCTLPNFLPTIIQFLNINMPHLNDINEHLEFLIEGVGPCTLLGHEEYDNADTYQHFGYLLFITLRNCWKQYMPNTNPFPQELSSLHNQYSIMNIISTKKVRMRVREKTPHIYNKLGIVLTTTNPYHDIL
jgi:hypothetical protein